jgi:hypothetical protein
MSLIQEALRRKDDENVGLPPKIIPFIAPDTRKIPVVQAGGAEKPPVRPAKTNRTGPVLMISLLVIACSIAAVGLLLYSARSLVQRGQEAKATHAAEVHVKVAPMASPVSTGIVKEGTMEKKPVPVEIRAMPVSPPVALQSSWPKLKVVGVMARTDVQDVAAIIDGNLAECGDEIRGVKVQKVDRSGVWFVFKGQTQFVRVGQTTL